jgi:hypothetical protein
MSTRAQIQIEGSDVLIYKHQDGYPEGVLPTLKPFVDSFFQNRGYDPAYFTARCVAAFAASYEKERAEWRARVERETPGLAKSYGLDRPDFLSLGVDTSVHGDIEYFYHVSKDGEITVRVPTEASRTVVSPVSTAVAAMRVVQTVKAPKRAR